MIILIRHAQSEGNKNREIHQTIPDHRVKLTPEGHRQAQEAGTRLRSLLRPDDKIHFFTSPYRRTRETTEGILQSLTADTPSPSPFPRHTITVYEEPRLREQDFGNFQPCSAEMERMWLERADYGHFFYRIPNGESAADAYDRVSGFNESMWRLFGEKDFASVCVLVTHGLMTRVFLMKWYHWSVEYFEDLRNINHCEFVIMKLNEDSGKYALQNQLRTWSELKREKELEHERERAAKGLGPANPTPSEAPVPIRRKWGGCPDGCSHGVHRKGSQRSSRAHSDQRKEQENQHNHNLTQDIGQEAINTVNEGRTITAPEPAIGDRLGDEMPLKSLPSNPQYHSTPEQPIRHPLPEHHHNHNHHHHPPLSPRPTKSPLFPKRPNFTHRDSGEDHLLHAPHLNYNLIHLVGRDGGGTLSGANSVAASEDEHDNHHHHSYDSENKQQQHELPRAGLKRHIPRASQDLDNDGDDEGSGRQTPKLRRTRSSHHRHAQNQTQLQTQTQPQTQNASTPNKSSRTIPDTDETGSSPEKQNEHKQQQQQQQQTSEQTSTQGQAKTENETENDLQTERRNETELEPEKSIEAAQKEDQSIRGSVY